MSVRDLYEKFDAIHDKHGLTEVACGGQISAEAANAALRELLPLTNAALYALAKAEGIEPFTLSAIPALLASLANPKSDIRKPESTSAPAA